MKLSMKLKKMKKKYNQIIILGDNYYPEKEKIDGVKKTVFKEDEFNSGFELLKNLNIPKKKYNSWKS